MPLVLRAQGASLPVDNVRAVQFTALGLAITLALVTIYLSARRLELQGDRLRYSHWLGQRAWPVRAITDITYQDDIIPDPSADFTWQSYLVLWRDREIALRLNLYYWPHVRLRAFMRELSEQHPDIRIGPRARLFLG